MSQIKKVLVSKNEKTDKATSTREINENMNGAGKIQENGQNEENLNNKNSKKNKKKKDINENKIEKVANGSLKNASKNIEKENIDLTKELNSLEKKVKEERENFLNKIKELNDDNDKKNIQINELTEEYKKSLKFLKNEEKKLDIESNLKSSYKIKSNEEIKKNIEIIDKKIKIYKKMGNASEDQIEKTKKEIKEKEGKEKDLEVKAEDLRKRVNSMEKKIEDMKIKVEEHKNCEIEIQNKLEEMESLKKTYEYQTKLEQIRASKMENNTFIIENEEKDDGEDNKDKALEDQKNILPKIKGLKFSVGPLADLEAKIVKKNKIRMKKSQSNAINIYNKLNTESNNNERYKIEAIKNIRVNNVKTKIKSKDIYFLKDYENTMLEKVQLPKNILKSYQEKFDNTFKEQEDLKKKNYK